MQFKQLQKESLQKNSGLPGFQPDLCETGAAL